MDEATLEYFVEEYRKERFLLSDKPVTSRFFESVRLEMDEKTGQGWSEILRIHNGLYMEMADYRLNQQLETCHRDIENLFHLTLLLSGDVDFFFPEKTKYSFASGDIWIFHGPFEQTVCNQYPEKNIRGISFGLPPDLVESWLGTACCDVSKQLERLTSRQSGRTFAQHQTILLARGLRQSSRSLLLAKKLISVRRKTLVDNLHFESLALDLLSRLLALEIVEEDPRMKRTKKAKAAIDEAVDILREEWNDPPSISSLARRVGLNECYLKKWFREKTDLSIGAYVRQQRMKKALELIETGRYSILTTAIFVGYSNPSHFSAAFKKFYGQLPSYYLP